MTASKRKLVEAKGYFGIVLSNKKKYVIKGEAVDPQTGLQGQYVFSDKTVDDLYDSHVKECQNCETLESYILKGRQVNEGFREFLKSNQIDVDRHNK